MQNASLPEIQVATELNCQHCGWPLIKNGKLKCNRCRKYTVRATLRQKPIFCRKCWNPPVTLAIKNQAVCPKCGGKTPMIKEEEMTTGKVDQILSSMKDLSEEERKDLVKRMKKSGLIKSGVRLVLESAARKAMRFLSDEDDVQLLWPIIFGILLMAGLAIGGIGMTGGNEELFAIGVLILIIDFFWAISGIFVCLGISALVKKLKKKETTIEAAVSSLT